MSRPDPDDTSMTIGLQNFNTPTIVYDLDFKTLKLKKKCSVHETLIDIS
jgi:hypothetical protein